jgi:CheY-like chemotaxis protein
MHCLPHNLPTDPCPRVLVIDDDPDIRAVTSASLEVVGGWQVLIAASGAEGLAIAQREEPDAILLDLQMPGLDGLATCGWLRQQPATRTTPVLLFTIVPEACDRHALAALGVRGVLAKPFDALRLPRDIAAALGWAPPRPSQDPRWRAQAAAGPSASRLPPASVGTARV